MPERAISQVHEPPLSLKEEQERAALGSRIFSPQIFGAGRVALDGYVAALPRPKEHRFPEGVIR